MIALLEAEIASLEPPLQRGRWPSNARSEGAWQALNIQRSARPYTSPPPPTLQKILQIFSRPTFPA